MDYVFISGQTFTALQAQAMAYTLGDVPGGLVPMGTAIPNIDGYDASNVSGILIARIRNQTQNQTANAQAYAQVDENANAQVAQPAQPVQESFITKFMIQKNDAERLGLTFSEIRRNHNSVVLVTGEFPRSIFVGAQISQYYNEENGRRENLFYVNGQDFLERLMDHNPILRENFNTYNERMAETNRETFISQAGNMFTAQSQQLTERKRILQRDIENTSRTLTNLIREMEANERRLAAEMSGEHDAVAIARREFESLTAVDKVVSARVENRNNALVVVVRTEDLVCENPRTNNMHQIGAFDIVIDPSRGTLWFDNLTRTVNNCQHPHIRDHVACLGNLLEALPSLFASREIAVIAQLAIRFIESVEPGDAWGSQISSWPLVGETSQVGAVRADEDGEEEEDEDRDPDDDDRY